MNFPFFVVDALVRLMTFILLFVYTYSEVEKVLKYE